MKFKRGDRVMVSWAATGYDEVYAGMTGTYSRQHSEDLSFVKLDERVDGIQAALVANDFLEVEDAKD